MRNDTTIYDMAAKEEHFRLPIPDSEIGIGYGNHYTKDINLYAERWFALANRVAEHLSNGDTHTRALGVDPDLRFVVKHGQYENVSKYALTSNK